MSTCTSCGGTIEDGYCNVCGLAAAPVPAASRPRPGPAASVPGRVRGPSRVGVRVGRVGVRGVGVGGQPPDLGHPGFPADQRPVGAGPARGGPGRDPAGALPRPGQRRARRPAGAGEPALLRQLRAAGRARPGRPGRADRGLLPQLRHPVLVQPEAGAGRPGGRAVRGARLPRLRRARLDLPGPGPQRQRPLGGAQGPAEHRGRGRHGGRGRRAAVPGPGGTPEHRPDLQLRPARGPADGGVGRVHRDGVRGRQVAQADPAGCAARRRFGAGGARDRVRHRGAARAGLPARPRAWCTATSSRTTSSRPRSSSSSSTWAGCAGSTATGRSTGPSATRRPRSGPTGRRCRRTCSRWRGRWPCSPSSSRATRAPTSSPSRTGCRCSSSRSRSPGCCAGPPTPTRTGASARPGRWPNSSPACCARCSRSPTARPGPRSPPCSAPSSRRSGPS